MIYIITTIGLAVCIVIGIDIYLAYTKGWTATLSYLVMLNTIKYPIIGVMLGFVIGLLFGHLFWSQTLNVTVPCPISQ